MIISYSFSFILLLFSMKFPQEPTIQFKIIPDSISIGDFATLNWKAGGADYVLISHVGKVNKEGTKVVKPTVTTKYLLLAESTLGIKTKQIELIVKGTKGDLEFPMLNDFEFPFDQRLAANSISDLVAHIDKILQEKLNYSTEWLLSPNGSIMIITRPVNASDLIQPDEKKIRMRRVAYSVEVSKIYDQVNQYIYTIKAFIQYRRKIEKTWRHETNSMIYSIVAKKLVAIIE